MVHYETRKITQTVLRSHPQEIEGGPYEYPEIYAEIY